MGAEFRSLSECLSTLKKRTGYSLDPVTDRPDNVSGYLSGTERDFACTKKSTGTKGIYWEGWYEEEVVQ